MKMYLISDWRVHHQQAPAPTASAKEWTVYARLRNGTSTSSKEAK